MCRLSALFVALLSLACLGLFAGVALLRAQSADLPPGTVQAKVTTACLECHDARIIVQQRLSKAAWTKEVEKMIKWGALVDPVDRDAFIDYLSKHFPPNEDAYAAPRTAMAKRKPRP